MSTISPSMPEKIALHDGRWAAIRPIRPDDAARLQAFHTRLSPETIYRRFLGVHPVLSEAEAARFTNIDYQTEMAFVATHAEEGEEDIVGVARYAALGPARPSEAEAAVVVEDRYQGQGLGTRLLERLLDHARSHSIYAFVAEISSHNDQILRFIEESGFPVEKRLDAGVWEIKVTFSE